MTEPELITEGVYRIVPGRSNCYLLADEKLALVDTGMPQDGEAILDAVKSIGRSPDELTHILLTHGHLDHIGSLAMLKKTTAAQAVAGVKDTAYIQGLKKTWTMGREGFGGKIFKAVLFIVETFFYHYAPAQVEIPCHGGEMLDCFGGVQVVATPGHSPGSISFYLREKRLLFVGDALNGTGGFALPMRFGCASYKEALRSVEQLSKLSFDTCLLGHGEPVGEAVGEKIKELLLNKPS